MLNIYGAVMCSRSGNLTKFCIENLLKYCKKVLIVLDNADVQTKKVVESFAKNHREVEILISPFPGTTSEEEETNSDCIRARWKNIQGNVRDLVFKRFHEMHNNGDKIDIIVFPDSDEIFSDNFPNLINKFWNSEFKAVMCKAVDVFGSFDTIHDNGMTCHLRIMKYNREITAIPYRWQCTYYPFKRNERMGDAYTLIHLSLLTPKMLSWREKFWGCKIDKIKQWPLWKVGKDVRHCTPDEISQIYKREPDLTVAEYLDGGTKRCPVGSVNAQNALFEASKMLDEMNIKHFLAFGTALGAYRDKSLLKLDWDIDLIILGECLHQIYTDFGEGLKNFNNILDKYGFTELKIKKDIPKSITADGESSECYTRTISFKKYGVRIDIDPAYISDCEKYRYILKGRKRQKFAAELMASWLNNPVEVTLNNKTYYLPGNTDEYLESNYGSDWKTPKNGPMDWRDRKCTRYIYACK
jgi:hypothetical protein